mgnify:CR=1 FL=1
MVAILAIMELGDLRRTLCFPPIAACVAILAIMELGDLQLNSFLSLAATLGRNPRYNGIG